MYSKITILSALVAICHAGLLVEDNHGHAVSSQSIVRHDQPTQQLNAHYSTPILTHTVQSAPILHSYYQQAPLVQHAAPLLQHSASLLQHAAPLVQHAAPLVQPKGVALVHATPISVGHATHQVEEQAPAHYEFSYSVEDPHTGDHKSQHESREGDVVKGEYSLVQPDGSVRTVQYTADHHNGFNAIVHNSAPSTHVAASHDAHGAPLVHAAPVAHAVPVLSYHH